MSLSQLMCNLDHVMQLMCSRYVYIICTETYVLYVFMCALRITRMNHVSVINVTQMC